MAARQLGCLALVFAIAASAAGCKDKGTDKSNGAVDFDTRCSQLAKACSDQDKHEEKVFDGCKALGQKQTDAACTAKLVALYDCYEKHVCGAADKVWAFEDLKVLADRHKACVDENKAYVACSGGAK
jgi:hypothetical protein